MDVNDRRLHGGFPYFEKLSLYARGAFARKLSPCFAFPLLQLILDRVSEPKKTE